MNALLAAINTKFAATSSLTSAFTGNRRGDNTTYALYWDAADEGTATPFLVAQVISSTPGGYQYGGVVSTETLVQFKGVGVGQAATVTKMETLIGVLDEFLPPLSSGRVTNVQRMGDIIPLRLEQDANGDHEYQATVDYLYVVATA